MFLLLALFSLPVLAILLIWYATDPKASPARERTIVLKQGCRWGLLVGALCMGLSPFGNVIPLPTAFESALNPVIAPAFLSVVALTLFYSGYRTARLTGRLRAGLLAGLLTGLFVFMLLGLSFIIIDMVFFDIVRQQPEKVIGFAHSGEADMRTYLFEGTVRGAIALTLVGSVLGAIVGSVGGRVGNRRYAQRRTG